MKHIQKTAVFIGFIYSKDTGPPGWWAWITFPLWATMKLSRLNHLIVICDGSFGCLTYRYPSSPTDNGFPSYKLTISVGLIWLNYAFNRKWSFIALLLSTGRNSGGIIMLHIHFFINLHYYTHFILNIYGRLYNNYVVTIFECIFCWA